MKITKDFASFYSDIVISVNRGLLGSVNPSLRGLAFEGDEITRATTFYFYNDGPLTYPIEYHYDVVLGEATADLIFGKPLHGYEVKVIRLDVPKPLPQHEYWIYRRREPFVDP